MIRLRWESDNDEGQVAWPLAAFYLAAIVCNYYYFYWSGFSVHFWGLAPAVLVAAISAGVTALAFGVPAAAAHSGGKTVVELIADAFGTAPAVFLRGLCATCLLLQIAESLRFFPSMVRFRFAYSDWSNAEWVGIHAGFLAFVFVTSSAALRTAVFVDLLGGTLIVAALLRVNDGWPRLAQWVLSGGHPSDWDFIPHGVNRILFLTLPFAFLAASLGRRLASKRDVLRVSLWGVAAPMLGFTAAVWAVQMATGASSFYQPSVQPTIHMALMAQTTKGGASLAASVAVLSYLGLCRLGVRAIEELLDMRGLSGLARWLASGALIAFVLAVPRWIGVEAIQQFILGTTTATSVIAGVVAGGHVAGVREPSGRKFDWIGLGVLVASSGALWYLPSWMVKNGFGDWGKRWLLPSAVIAFVLAWAGRNLEAKWRDSPAQEW